MGIEYSNPYHLLDDASFIFNVLETGRNFPEPVEFNRFGFDIVSYRLRRGLLEQLATTTMCLASEHRNFVNDAEQSLYPQAREYFRS